MAAGERGRVGCSVCEWTAGAGTAARHALEQAGFDVLNWTADGAGGMAMEAAIAAGMVQGVLDLTTTELANQLAGGLHSAGVNRMTAAALRGIPQVISLGGLDFVTIAAPLPEKFRGRAMVQVDAKTLLVRTSAEENDRLGREIAEKASAARGATAIIIPKHGFSKWDQVGQPFWAPEADQVLVQSLGNSMGPQVKRVEMAMHINDAEFGKAAAELLLRMMQKQDGLGSSFVRKV